MVTPVNVTYVYKDTTVHYVIRNVHQHVPIVIKKQANARNATRVIGVQPVKTNVAMDVLVQAVT